MKDARVVSNAINGVKKDWWICNLPHDRGDGAAGNPSTNPRHARHGLDQHLKRKHHDVWMKRFEP